VWVAISAGLGGSDRFRLTETLILWVVLTLADIPAMIFVQYFMLVWIYDVLYLGQKLGECQELWAAIFCKFS